MNPWIYVLLTAAAVVFALDYLLRRKKWKDHTGEEKISLLINMFSVGPYVFLSVLGLLWGITPGSPESAFGWALYDVTLTMGETYFVVAAAAALSSLIFRKAGKTKASIWVNILALAYIVAVLTVNYLAGKLM